MWRWIWPNSRIGHAERLALAGVVHHHPQAALGDAERHGGQGEALDLEVAHHVEQALALGAEQVVGRHAAVVEDQLGGHRGAHAELLFQTLTEGEAGDVLLDHERADAALAGPGVDQEHVAERLVVDGAVGDERLAAVEDVVIAVALGGGAHAEHVGARFRLGHAHAADPFAGEDRRQDALPLRRRGVAVEVVHEQHAVGEVGEGEARVGGRQRLVDDHRRGRIEPGAAVAPRRPSGRAARAPRRGGRAPG